MPSAPADAAPRHARRLRFLAFGAFNTVLTYAVYWVLVAWLPAQVAYALVYALGIVVAYLGNALWVFAARPRVRTALAYPLLYGVQYLAGAGLLALATGPAGLAPRPALALVIVALVPLSYALNRALLAPREGGGP